ncbi:Glycerophosphoryl diester phosphodiesterase family-domain-containing protein [Radiomyces spectabilis]|uniref:Glycerophosphoryl diester phosphodiesterase family-domain-containing protein n=1 Tax=Radiomyces spectabilis TaxID=64574 RepID=UPI00221F837D|nr:Glycerophosphoryl diester phosphodiesterase family-domain-containing protein [Radiomyces spectabilis]KAI8368197.1 Glycerophosphoryl diester phosphodiesterase family-domain-containing protein [Radiomyces spectabilis]
MKFGKTLLNNQLPEWSKNYLSYKGLKKSINEASHKLPPCEETTTAQIDRRLWILSEKYEQRYDGSSCDDLNEEELVSALQETRAQINKLMWFAELNTKGFRKILKKLDKKLGLETQAVYWETKVAVLPFAAHAQMRSEIDKLTQWIATMSISDDRSQSPTHPAAVHVKLPMQSKIGRLGLLTEQEHQDLNKTIETDNKEELTHLLVQVNGKPKHEAELTRYALLESATQHGALDCLQYLIESGVKPLEHRDINERNLLHKLAILADALDDKCFTAIKKLLDLAPALAIQTDFAGRRPLHYAAESSHPQMARILLEHAMKHAQYDNSGFMDPVWQDREGHTPLFLAILHGNPETLRTLVELGHIEDIDRTIAAAFLQPRFSESNILEESESIPEFARLSHHPAPVAMACKLGNLDLLNLLIDKGSSVDLADDDGETALLLAIRSNFVEGVKALIERGHVNVNLAEKVNDWTPLIVAAIEGHLEIINLLLDAGADKTLVDFNGWAAYEHAVFRGYLDIGKLTKPDNAAIPVDPPVRAELTEVENKPNKSLARASRLYGHKYLTDQSMIIVTLGSNDVRNPLSRRFLNVNGPLYENQRLSIAVSAINATGEFPILDLPSNNEHHLLHPEPIVLFASNPEEVVLRFDLIETFGSSPSNNILARGTSVLKGDQIFSKTKAFKGRATGNSSLRGQQTVPLVDSTTLEYAGSLGFEFFVITPFAHKNMRVGDRYTYYKSVDTKVIGHRGSGMNKKGSRLQVGENTVLSFVTAASLGAEYVEFDVQLTKDLTPVIYHDWTVTETGYDIPLNAITIEQFMNLRPSGHIKEYHTGVSDGIHGERMPTINNPDAEDLPVPSSVAASGIRTISAASASTGKRVSRSHSLSSIGGPPINNRTDATKRLELTRTNKLGKLKGNGPETIQAPFTTLAETLKKVPKSAGCNIEVKYPMIDEAENEELHQFQELNIYVDTILECVYEHAEQDRHIIFSSFHPEICLALNLKQPNYPVFFLTDAGTLSMADVRCNSLQGAVRFAKQADLLGVVAASEPILAAPKMVKVIKETGLLLFTYGVLNNEVENAVAQKYYGVDAVIVDSVLAVRKGLRGD